MEYKKLKRCLIDINNQLNEKRMPYETYKSLIIKRDAIKEELKKIPVDGRIVTIGEITDDGFASMTPLEAFKTAFNIAQHDTFSIETNNPQVLELLSLLCDDLEVYLKIGEKSEEIDIYDAYGYLGDLYDVINRIDAKKFFSDKKIEYQDISDDLEEYEKKYMGIVLT